jgi:2-(1,2-epoxy-1,2-dihydrophenyl)acetyl-CoA isomerase
MTSQVEYQCSNNVAVIRLNDPNSLNALSIPIVQALQAAFARAAGEARAALICGAGRGFCSGWNLATTAPDAGPFDAAPFDAGVVLETLVNPFMQTLRDLPIPLVSAVHGPAAGAGASLALAADIVVAGESAYFLQAFRRIGLVPDAGATWLLTQSVGRARAMELMLLGERLAAPKALEWGLINRVTPDADVFSTAHAIATELAAGPTIALAMIRKAAWLAAESNFTAALDTERAMQARAGATADFAEGVKAFFEKRAAAFSGA